MIEPRAGGKTVARTFRLELSAKEMVAKKLAFALGWDSSAESSSASTSDRREAV
jgi:hypothetical protein